MRFGQIVVSLNKALDRPRHDIFSLEEDEMMEVLRRFFSTEYQKAVKEDNRGAQLTERWEDALQAPLCPVDSMEIFMTGILR